MYLYDGSFDIQMLNYCHPNCLSHFKPVKFDLCVQIEQIQIATAYLQSMTCDGRLQLEEVRCVVASCDVRAEPILVVTCDVRACGAF